MSISAIDLNLLVVLDAVLTERSVARAARRLHVTPSAISNALARLRVALGDPLFARSGRGIVPTPRAVALAPALTRALRDLEHAVHGAAFDPATTTREFSLAIADSGQMVRLPRIATLLAAEMPRARLRVMGIDTFLTGGGLASTEVDVAIAVGEKSPGLHLEPLYRERTVLVARRNHPQAGERVSRSALASLRHVEVQVAPGKGYRALPGAYARLGIARDVALVVPNFSAAAAVVAETNLVATLPASLLSRLGPRLGLRGVQSPVPSLTLTINLCWHERTHADPAMRSFRDLIRRAGAAPRPRRTSAAT
ncbi:LysR family transcriptional regulator [Myxococcus sp. SDU36]|uniref:LysR family transcriptional regulator n=1 Tax=Myxococcus sp. SDU36 TaxID=2831967 RepID=UPI002543CB35|nr:LysR family transcriptional regulator [Myxococcus sp. SDU36]WIG94908.1 LysR family transcriptional regulator [Myxococcus sp. SDU36]